jgi:hypothetical protein
MTRKELVRDRRSADLAEPVTTTNSLACTAEIVIDRSQKPCFSTQRAGSGLSLRRQIHVIVFAKADNISRKSTQRETRQL